MGEWVAQMLELRCLTAVDAIPDSNDSVETIKGSQVFFSVGSSCSNFSNN